MVALVGVAATLAAGEGLFEVKALRTCNVSTYPWESFIDVLKDLRGLRWLLVCSGMLGQYSSQHTNNCHDHQHADWYYPDNPLLSASSDTI